MRPQRTNRQKRDALHRAIFNSVNFSSISTDASGVIQLFNVGAEQMLGYAAADVVNRLTPADLSDSEELTVRAQVLSRELGTPIAPGFEALTVKASRGIEDIYELTYLRKDGIRLPAMVSVTALRDGKGAIIGYLLIGTDNSARKQAEAARLSIETAFFNERERARVTLNSIGDAVISTDTAGRITYLNPAAEQVTDWSSADAIGRPLLDVLNIIDAATRLRADDPSAKAMQQLEMVHLDANCGLIRRDGSELLIEDSAAPIHDRQGRISGAVIVFRDVTEARTLSLKMTHFSRYDILTELPNRTLLDDRIGQAIAMAKRDGTRLALLFIDLDRFKNVNDSFGHAAGDAILKSIGERLVACLRATDTISRWGGDEFVVLLTQLDEADTAAVSAAKVLRAVSAPHTIGDQTVHIRASIGIAVGPDDAGAANDLIGAADSAMYRAKEQGGNSYEFFTSQVQNRALDRRILEASLGEALRRQELVLYYQPKNNLDTSETIGAEALVRWQHPKRGLLAPSQFVAIAEECGLIVPIGRWILREACRQARAWQDEGLPPLPIAVNVSATEFRSKEFLEGVAAVLSETGLEAKYLELEVTESVLMENTPVTAAVLRGLKGMGVQIAIDDFGTGHSSLSYLSRFPIDTLKIDRSFIEGISVAGHDSTIVNAIIALARSLKHNVVAEGVETGHQVELLKRQQCIAGQGFYFSEPVGPLEFASLLRRASGLPRETARLGES